MLSIFVFLLQMFVLDRMVNFQDGLFYGMCSLGIFAVMYIYARIRQHYFRRDFKEASGWKRYRGFMNYHVSDRYLLLFVCVFLHQLNHPVLANGVYFYTAMTLCIEVVIKNIVKEELEQMKKHLTEETRIIIMQNSCCLKPGRFWGRFWDLLFRPYLWKYLNYKSSGSYQKYIAIHDITALIGEELIAENSKYMCIAHVFLERLYCSEKNYRKIVVQPLYHSCKQYLLACDKPEDKEILDHPRLPYPKEKFQIYDLRQSDKNLISHIIKCIEMISDERAAMERRFRPLVNLVVKDSGKQYAQSLLRTMLDTQQNDTEYFYSLLKINEFMIHYQSLAEYEAVGSRYLDLEGDTSPSLGTLANGIAFAGGKQPEPDAAFITAVKMLHTLSTGHTEGVPGKRAISYAREQICALRNRYIGHGTMTYSVSRELLVQFAIITEQLARLFLEQEHISEFAAVHARLSGGYDKWMQKDGRFYLLAGIYRRNDSCKYLDYATGHMLSVGNVQTIVLCPGMGEVL